MKYLLCILILWPAFGVAQETDQEVYEDFIITDLDIIGNFRTKDWVIRRELQFQVGDRILIDDMEAARNRLLNLQIFNNVFIEGDEEGAVTVEVSEQFRYMPITALSATDGRTQDAFADFSKFFDIMTATVGVADLNHNGSGAQVDLQFRFGATDGFAANYGTRWLSPRLPIRFRLGLRTLSVSDKHASVQDTSRRLRDQLAYVEIATRRGAVARLGAKLMFRRIARKTPRPGEEREYRTWWFSPFLAYDRRDLEWYPRRGVYANASVSAVHSSDPFFLSTYSLRSFHSLNQSRLAPILALRFAAGTSTSNTPDWSHYYFGFASLLRGHSSEKSEAATYLLGDIELRIPCMSEITYDIPLLGRNGRNIPFWWGLVFFAERAELQLDGERAETFAGGGGLHFRVPYVQIIELTGAVNRDGEFDVVIQSGVKF